MGNTSPSPPFSFRVGSSSGDFHSLPPFSISPDGTAAIFDAPPYPIVRELSSDDGDVETMKAVFSSALSSAEQAPVDWKDTPAAHIFKVDVPGMKKQDVKVAMEEEGSVLVISGERAAEEGTWFYAERRSGKFVRKFPLPEDAKAAEIKAAMENGVLTVTVPKVEEKQKKSRSIDILG